MVSVNVRVVRDCHHMSLGFLGQLRTGGQLGTTLVVLSDARREFLDIPVVLRLSWGIIGIPNMSL